MPSAIIYLGLIEYTLGMILGRVVNKDRGISADGFVKPHQSMRLCMPGRVVLI